MHRAFFHFDGIQIITELDQISAIAENNNRNEQDYIFAASR